MSSLEEWGGLCGRTPHTFLKEKFVPQRKEHTFAKMKINMLKSTPVLKLQSLNA